MNFVSGMGLYEALKAEGYELPEGCRNVDVVFEIDDAVALRMIVLLTDENLAKFGRACLRMSQKVTDGISR